MALDKSEPPTQFPGKTSMTDCCYKDSLVTIFEDSARRFPERPAVWRDGLAISYAELDKKKEEVRRGIISIGLGGAKNVIGLLCTKSLSAYAGMLGIMSSGNIYAPINPDTPTERKAQIINAASINVLIADTHSLLTLVDFLSSSTKSYTIIISGVTTMPAELECLCGHKIVLTSTVPFHTPSKTENYVCATAYLMFTSGSTGAPKGVPVTHRSASTMVHNLQSLLHLHANDRVTHFSDLIFDFSIGELFLCWNVGACIYIPAMMDKVDPAEFVNRNQLTIWCSVPSLASHVEQIHPSTLTLPSLRMSLFCGEAMPSNLAKFWQGLNQEASLYNLYGPTEAAVFATAYKYLPAKMESPDPLPIGWPLESVMYQIMPSDELMASTGELLLSGPQIIEGYWDSDMNTDRSFYIDAQEGKRWYRTGDIVSLDREHGLLFRGRMDHQIKLRGYRIEMQEVETILRLITEDKAAVVALRDDNGNPIDMVAFCKSPALTDKEMKKACAAHLPAYMIPKHIVRVDNFPLNRNGKTDYLKLVMTANVLFKEPQQDGSISETEHAQ